MAAVAGTNVQVLRRKGVDARLVLFTPSRFQSDGADLVLNLQGKGLLRRQAAQWLALARLLPTTDIFHFYFGLTLVPKSFQFPILHATRKKSVFHFLGADIRDTRPENLRYGIRADARIVGSFDALRYIPFDADVIPPGIDVRAYTPVPPVERERVRVVHAPSSRERKGTEHVVAACSQLPVDLDIVEGVRNVEALKRYAQADIVVDQLHRGWHGLFTVESMALGKPVVTSLHEASIRRTEQAFGVKVPIVAATTDNLVEKLRPLVESAEERRRIGAASRSYVERVHDLDQMAARLLAVYARL